MELRRTAYAIAACMLLFLQASNAYPAVARYALGSGDKLRITVFRNPDLSGEFTIDSSGLLSLPLIGEVQAAGLNVAELEERIKEGLKDGYLNNPGVNIEILEYRPFYILGGVKNPGGYPYQNDMTVLRAIVLAGGYLVDESSIVRLRLDLTRAREIRDLLIERYWAEITREARLFAEQRGLDEIQFSEEILQRQDDPRVVAISDGENRIFQTRRNALAGEVSVLENQISQYHEEISALRAQMQARTEQVKLLQAEMKDVEALLSKGLVPKRRLTALQRDSVRLEGDRSELLAFIARANQNIAQTELDIINVRNTYLNEVVRELQESRKEIVDIGRRIQTQNEIMREIEANVGHVKSNLEARTNESIVVTREAGDSPEVLEVTLETVVAPGDVIRVPKTNGTSFVPDTKGEPAATE